MLTQIFLTLALTSAPTPAPNYNSWFSEEVANEIIELVENNEYRNYLDFNNDGILNTVDVVSVQKRYNINCEYGNTLTVKNETIEEIFSENGIVPLYWEFSKVGEDITRQYEIETDKIINATVYYECEDFTSGEILIEVNPFEEIVKVLN